MLQFDRTKSVNKNAVYIETFNSASDYYDSLVAVVSQSYDISSGSIDLITVSSPTQYRNWLVIENSGSVVPTATGQYDVSIFQQSTGSEARWEFTDQVWETTGERWATFGDGGPIGSAIYQDRAYIVGSDESSITEYVSPNENGQYKTYNG